MYWLFLGGGLTLGFFSAAVLLSRRDGTAGVTQFLAAFLALCSLNIAHPLIVQSLLVGPMTQGGRVLEPLQFLMAPLFAGYIRSLLVGLPLRLKDGIHGLPTLSVIVLSFTPLIATHSPTSDSHWIAVALWGALLLQASLYLMSSARWLHRYQAALRNKIADTREVDLGWLRWIFHLLFGLFALYGILFVLMIQGPTVPPIRTYLSLALTVLVALVSYRGLLQKPTPVLAVEEVLGPPPKYQKSALSDADTSKLSHRLNELMEREKPYRDPNLTLPSLAERLNVPRNNLSYVINRGMGRNFFDYVNEYRVREVQRLMNLPERRGDKLLSLAFDAGFRSKPAFNAVFKKVANLTPSQYRAQLLKESGLVLPDKTPARP